MADTAPTSYQEVLDHLSKFAAEKGDSFRLKVLRRPNAASQQTQHVALFGDATLSMIVNAESWLGAFAGGGLYVIHIYDGAEGRKYLAVVTPSEIPGSPRPPDVRVTKTSGWLGPTLIDSPTTTIHHPLASEPQTSTVSSRANTTEAGFAGLFDTSQRVNADIQRQQAELVETKRQLDEQRHRNDLDAMKRESESARRASEERIRALEMRLENAKPAPGPNISEIVTALVTALAPIVGAILQTSAQGRKDQLDLERMRLEGEARAREAEKGKPLIAPELLEIFDRQTKRAEESATQFASFMKAQAEGARSNLESQAIAQRTMLQSIADIAQLTSKVGGGEPESKAIDWKAIVAGGLQALAAMQRGPAMTPSAPPPGMAPPQLAGANGAAQPPEATEPPPRSAAFTKVEEMCRAKKPPSDVCEELKKALEDPEAKKELDALGGPLGVFDERLGGWSQDSANEAYVTALQTELVKSGVIPSSAFN